MDNELMDSSIGRRDVLKKAAVGAAVAWTAPVIMSSKVGASSGGTCDTDCRRYYLIKIDLGGDPDDNVPFESPGFGDCGSQFAQLLGGRVVYSGGGGFVQVLNASGNELKIKLPLGFDVTFALRKQTATCMGACSNISVVCDATGGTFTINCGTYSNYILVVCGPTLVGSPINVPAAIAASVSPEPLALDAEIPAAEIPAAEIPAAEIPAAEIPAEETPAAP